MGSNVPDYIPIVAAGDVRHSLGAHDVQKLSTHLTSLKQGLAVHEVSSAPILTIAIRSEHCAAGLTHCVSTDCKRAEG